MSYSSIDELRVYRQRGDRLEELTRTQLQRPEEVLWIADRLLVTEQNAVAELEVSGTRLERRSKVFTSEERIHVSMWCAVENGLAIFDGYSKNILYYMPV